MKNHGNQPKFVKNHETTLKNHGNQPKTIKNHETTLKNHGNQPKTMKNHKTTLTLTQSPNRPFRCLDFLYDVAVIHKWTGWKFGGTKFWQKTTRCRNTEQFSFIFALESHQRCTWKNSWLTTERLCWGNAKLWWRCLLLRWQKSSWSPRWYYLKGGSYHCCQDQRRGDHGAV